MYYVYLYLDPRKTGTFVYGEYCFSCEPFYVGKGSGKRSIAHIQPKNLKTKSPKNQKINKLIRNGYKPIILLIQETLTESDAFNLEIKLIETVGRKDKNEGPLLNLYDGGYGSSKSKETREKISATKKRQYANGEVIHPLLGKTHSAEARLKMSIAHKGSKWTIKQKQNLKKVRCEHKCYFTKQWKVTDPHGNSQVVFGLGQFCRENGLSQSHMFRVSKGQRNHHKGWKCELNS